VSAPRGRPSGGGDIMWAPWRMTYVGAEVRGEHDGTGCVFCDLPASGDDARAYILARGLRAFLIMNLFPYNNGHLMAVPYAHVPSLRALDVDTLGEMMALVQRAQGVIAEAMRPQGFNVGVNEGRAAGAGIADHVHMHLVPRWVGDTNFMPALSDTRVMPQHLDETYALLRPGFDAPASSDLPPAGAGGAP
jgi:ATP adenylyltransferase